MRHTVAKRAVLLPFPPCSVSCRSYWDPRTRAGMYLGARSTATFEIFACPEALGSFTFNGREYLGRELDRHLFAPGPEKREKLCQRLYCVSTASGLAK
ncbi:hypothetical protein VTK26DRAFT_8882 [Humicola hyalothermophila]